jgi:membrane protease subunit HflK
MSDSSGFRPSGAGKLVITSGMIIAVIVVLVVVAGFFTSVFTVAQQERGVVTRFGKYNRTVQPGLNYKLPLGIEQHFKVSTEKVQSMSFGFRTLSAGVDSQRDSTEYDEESIMLTGDLNIIDVEWIIQYYIRDPQQWLFNVDNQEVTIRDISQSVVNELIGDRSINNVLGIGTAEIERQALDKMNQYFDLYELGIDVVTVELTSIVPPKGAVEAAFKDVQNARQDMERAINEGQQRKNEELPKARGDKERIIQVAKGYAEERVNRAEGDVARFNEVLAEYRQDPITTRDRLYFEMMEEIFAESDNTVLIDKTLQNFLPLLNLNQEGTNE